MLNGVGKLQDRMAAKDAEGAPVPGELPPGGTGHPPRVRHREGLTPMPGRAATS